MTIDKDKLNKIFSDADKDLPVGILVQHSPDPDCLGAAAGIALLLRELYGLDSKVFHYGEISHPQNKSIVNVLHISLSPGDDFKPEDVCRTVVVDTDLSSTGFMKSGLERVDVRIDHHSMERDADPVLKDVRLVGSTCAIVWDYLREFDVSLDEEADVATALVLGIKTDTLDFTSSTTAELDMEAFRNLLPLVNKTALAKLTKYAIPKLQFEIESKAFSTKEIKEAVLVSFIGEISPHNRDIIATIADRFTRMDTVSTVVIIGVIGNHLIASVRSEDTRVNVANLCASVFGKELSGAKEGSGGARIPLGAAFEYIDSAETKAKVMSEVVATLKEKIFQLFGEE